MSKRKRNVDFIKPDQPDFLKRIREQIGYKEPDTIDAKRGPIQNFSDDDEDYEEKEDEKPIIVQIKKGDLTEEEAAKLAKEEAEKPADLSQRVVFKAKKKDKDAKQDSNEPSKSTDKLKKDKKDKPSKNLLSFEDEDDEG